MMPITKSATTRFLTPARIGAELALSAEVTGEAASLRDPLLIRCAIRDAAGAVLTEIDFEYVLLPQERFMKAVGLNAMPEHFRRHFGK
jgi:hypothetical protein